MDDPENILEPLPYHVELRDYLKSEERELWNWFASAQAKADYTENLRLELLKSTYRLATDGHPELYQSLDEAKTRLQLNIPVTLYQAQNSPQLNAALYYIPGQGHIVFSGPMFTLLNAEELKSYVEKQQKERAELQNQIRDLNEKRQTYIDAEKKRLAAKGNGDAFDEKVAEMIRAQAARKQIEYGK